MSTLPPAPERPASRKTKKRGGGPDAPHGARIMARSHDARAVKASREFREQVRRRKEGRRARIVARVFEAC